MENNMENAQVVLSKYTGLNDESALGISVISAMVEYAKKCAKAKQHKQQSNCNLPQVIKAVCVHIKWCRIKNKNGKCRKNCKHHSAKQTDL